MLIKYFVTGQGDKIPCVTREQIIEIDRIAEHETGPNLWQMMENAGRNLMEFICKSLGTNWHKKEILVLAGKGNNGGGGICAARHLINHGGNVKLAVADMERLNEAPFYQRQIYENSGGKSYPFEEAKLLEPDIIIDAILGYNLKGPPKGVTNEMIQWANSKKAEIISLDIPSGVDSTTGGKTGNYIKPNATLTLALPKTGLLNCRTGKLYLADVGIPLSVYKKVGINYTSPFNSDYIVPICLAY